MRKTLEKNGSFAHFDFMYFVQNSFAKCIRIFFILGEEKVDQINTTGSLSQMHYP